MKKIQFYTILILSLLIYSNLLLASNVGRDVYILAAEDLKWWTTGAHYDTTDDDGVKVYQWNSDSGLLSGETIYGDEFICTRYTINKTSGWDVVAHAPVPSGDTVVPRDMSAYANGYIKCLIRTTRSSFSTATIGFQYKDSSNNDVSYTKALSELSGFSSDGNWHEVSFSLPSSSKLNKVIALFLFQPNTLTVGHYIDIAEIRWVKSTASSSFDAELKNDDDTSAETITWNESVFRQGWQVANQHIDLKMPSASMSDLEKTWSIKVYTIGGTNENNGLRPYKNNVLYTEAPNLPMCWRMTFKKLPCEYITIDNNNTVIATKTITYGYSSSSGEGGLYDGGVTPAPIGYWTWPYLLDAENTKVKSKDGPTLLYITAWSSSRGYHMAAGGLNFSRINLVKSSGSDIVLPRIYFGADFTNAFKDLTYKANIRIEYSNE